MKHAPLLELRLRHPAYAGARCVALSLTPQPEWPSGARALERHRLLVRNQHDGLDVLGQLDGGGQPFVDFQALTLSFDIEVLDPDFFARTDLSEIMPIPANTDTSPSTDRRAPTWQYEAPGTTPRLVEGKAPLRAGMFGVIEIGGVKADWLRQPQRFELTFKPREALWVYYLLTRRTLSASTTISIEGSIDGRLKVPFEGGPLVARDELGEEDPFGAHLLQEIQLLEKIQPPKGTPPMHCRRWVSSKPVPCVPPPSGLTLRIDDSNAQNNPVGTMKLPNPQHLFALRLEGHATPEAALACVVEY